MIVLSIKWEFFTIGLWLLYDYLIFKFTWFLFGNWVNIRRKLRKYAEENKKPEINFNF